MLRISTDELAAGVIAPRAGERVLLSGTAYTARDAAHARIVRAMELGESLPFPLMGAVIYYAGPTPTPPGMAIGSCGPTTSGRMDVFAPRMTDAGLCCTIGKGPRSEEVIKAIVRNRALYLCAIGGAGALASAHIKSSEVIAYEDLGCESVKKIMLEDFPLIVGIDRFGGNIFKRE